MYTMRNMADELGVSKQTIYRFISLNKIEGIEDKFANKTKLYTNEQYNFIKENINLNTRLYSKSNKPHQPTVEYSIEEKNEILRLQHENELLKLELKLKNEIIEILKANKTETNKIYTNDIVDGAVTIKEKVIGAVTKKSHNQNPYPDIEKFLIEKKLTIEQIISDQESEQFNLTVADNRLSAKERSQFKKELGELLGHRDSSSTGRTFRSYVKKVLANNEL